MNVITLAMNNIADTLEDLQMASKANTHLALKSTPQKASILFEGNRVNVEKCDDLMADFKRLKGLSYARATKEEKDFIRKYARV
jgi:hypothetical protein